MTTNKYRGVAQLGQSACFGNRRSQVRILSPRLKNNKIRGCSSMVEHQPSKLDTWVRFPSPAFAMAKNALQKCVRSSVGQSNGLLSRGSGVRIPSSTFEIELCLISLWWVQRSWLARQIVALEAKGSNPFIHLFGLSPSGKAQDFDSCIRWFKSSQPSLVQSKKYWYGILAQSVEHLTFNQVVRGSNPRCLI